MQVIENGQKIGIGIFNVPKGLMMIGIILLHCITLFYRYWEMDVTSNPIKFAFGIIISFAMYCAMPVFFIMCGYSMRKDTIKNSVLTQVKLFAWPYFWLVLFVTIGVIIKSLIKGDLSLKVLTYYVVPYAFGFCPGDRYFCGLFMNSIGPVWFVLAFIWASILLNIILQCENIIEQIAYVLSLVAIAFLIKTVVLPFCIQQGLICTSYMYIGWLIKKNKGLRYNFSKLFILLVCAVVVLFSFFGFIDVSQNTWKLGAIDYIISVLAGFVFFLLFVKLCNLKTNKLTGILSYIGMNAFYICCIHTVVYTAFPWKTYVEVFNNRPIIGFVGALLLNFIVIFVVMCIINLIRKTKERIVCGKN